MANIIIEIAELARRRHPDGVFGLALALDYDAVSKAEASAADLFPLGVAPRYDGSTDHMGYPGAFGELDPEAFAADQLYAKWRRIAASGWMSLYSRDAAVNQIALLRLTDRCEAVLTICSGLSLTAKDLAQEWVRLHPQDDLMADLPLCGARLRRQRLAANLTQDELGERVGASKVSISRWESGERAARPATVAKLAQALGCSPEDLV